VNFNYPSDSTAIDMAQDEYDVGVIGGGPGGYVAAIRAAQLGGKVVVVERDSLGGTCTNWGCIPTKALLRAVELISDVRRAGEFGLTVAEPSYDLTKITERMDRVVERLVQGTRYLLKSNGVELLKGVGKIASAGTIAVVQNDQSISLNAAKIIVATGSRAKTLPIPGAESPGVITSDKALHLEKVPPSLVIIGGGPEGAEFACIFSRLGSEVAIVEMLPNLLPLEDREVGIRLNQILTKQGVRILTNTAVKSISEDQGTKKVLVQSPSGELTLEGNKVLMAVGRSPNIENIGLEELGIKNTKSGIEVDDRMETNVKGVYAIGDVAGGGLAHVAFEEGIVAAENAMGLDSKIDLRVVPRCIYTIPEVAAVGLTEDQAKEQGHELLIGKFPFTASGRALTLGETEGIVKVLADKSTKEILGVHIVGPRASDIIPEAVLAMRLEATTEDLARAIHPHPTLSEALKEAALDCERAAIHIARRGRVK